MDSTSQTETGHGRIEKRTAFVTEQTDWLPQKSDWKGLICIGAIQTVFESKHGSSSERHYYLSPIELLHHARMEWSVETMHWLLDVHFEEDWCRVEDKKPSRKPEYFSQGCYQFY